MMQVRNDGASLKGARKRLRRTSKQIQRDVPDPRLAGGDP